MSTVREMTNVPFEEIVVGQSAELSVTLTKTQLDMLALVSGDADAFHFTGDAGYSRSDVRKTEGVGAEAILSAVIGIKLPGPGSRILSRSLAYKGDIHTGDTITATVTVRQKQTEGAVVVLDGRCLNQHGDELVTGTVSVAAPTSHLFYDDITPPNLVLRRNDAFAGMFMACEGCDPVVCAVAHPCDNDSLMGAIEAARRKLIIPVLVGPEDKIRGIADSLGIDLSPYQIISTPHSHASAAKAVELASSGQAEAIMKGSLHTDEIMGAIVPVAAGLRTSRRISHAFIMDVPTYHKPFIISDAAVNIFPNLEVKVDIVQNAIDLAHVLKVANPKVALLSAVETVTSKIPSTLDAAALCKMADRGQITGGIIDGPLAFDNAISAEAAKTKGIASPVSGDLDIMVAPDLESANMIFKQLTYLAGAEGAGIVLGTRVPVVLTSRADTVRTRLTSTAVMTLIAHARRTGKYETR
ncbi:MAG: bifunctional enoyl-CoA hydratase/phosphate acetyltransferase [Smithella sp.]